MFTNNNMFENIVDPPEVLWRGTSDMPMGSVLIKLTVPCNVHGWLHRQLQLLLARNSLQHDSMAYSGMLSAHTLCRHRWLPSPAPTAARMQ